MDGNQDCPLKMKRLGQINLTMSLHPAADQACSAMAGSLTFSRLWLASQLRNQGTRGEPRDLQHHDRGFRIEPAPLRDQRGGVQIRLVMVGAREFPCFVMCPSRRRFPLESGPWLVGATRAYSGVGADIVMESIARIEPAPGSANSQFAPPPIRKPLGNQNHLRHIGNKPDLWLMNGQKR